MPFGGQSRQFPDGVDVGDLGGINIEDLLGGLFGGRGFGPIRGADQETELDLTVEEAFRGGRRSVTLDCPDGRRTLDVKIPAGVTNGQRIRLAGQGGRGSEGAPNGTCISWPGSPRTPDTASTDAICTSTSRSRRGKPRWHIGGRRNPQLR